MAAIRELVEDIAKALVEKPDQVVVRENDGGHATLLELRVAPEDLGRVIGKQGRTARSIRLLLAAVSLKSNRRISLEIAE
ncbi:MAG: KH domain-containing protein [Bryobacteraceae bacterium]|nr:KH domain-containing protein [Bryobacteraceae bacterium]